MPQTKRSVRNKEQCGHGGPPINLEAKKWRQKDQSSGSASATGQLGLHEILPQNKTKTKTPNNKNKTHKQTREERERKRSPNFLPPPFFFDKVSLCSTSWPQTYLYTMLASEMPCLSTGLKVKGICHYN